MKLGELMEQLESLKGDDQAEVRLIVGGTAHHAHHVDQVWWEPHQEGQGAVCIGDDPR